jgi:hypothetical protein
MHRLLFIAALALAAAPLVANADCEYTAQRNFDVPAAGIGHVAFELGSSDIELEGAPGLSTIEVRGRACASDPAWLDALTVDQNRSGDTLTITPHNGHDLHGNGWHNYAYVDLHVRVPAAVLVAMNGQSGDATVRNVGSLDFATHSGDLEASHIAGALGIKLSSGDVRANDIGSVDVRGTSSGDINLDDVHGAVDVASSGSGDLHFRRTGGVRVGSVGSGDISVSDAAGDVSIDSIGSGDIDVDGVRGNFTVGSRGSGDIGHRNVSGKVSVPRDHDEDGDD